MDTVGSLFAGEPSPWGYRGDPYMWRDLKKRLSETPLPDSAQECEQLIRQTLYEIIKAEATNYQPDCQISLSSSFYIERFAHGGMSSGHVSIRFWETTGIPMLVERYNLRRDNADKFP